VCRPLIICDNGVPRVTTDHINKLKAGEWGFSDFLKRGKCVTLSGGRGKIL
jgi:DNA-directed RNA polymerase III subunit RPC2